MAKLFICGDIINQQREPFLEDRLAHRISEADYRICNLEGPELMTGQQVSCPHQEAGTIRYLRQKGFDLFLLANNHITELGEKGVDYTIKTICNEGGSSVGAGLSFEQAYKPLITNIAGLTFGFVNVCEAQEGHYLSPSQSYGYAWMGFEGLFPLVQELSKTVDHVVVFVHSGLEHYHIPIPELRQFYHLLCDVGASCVIGGHTHTAQGYEYYDQKLIVYSLGNFYFPHPDGKYQQENNSYSVLLDFSNAKRIEVEPICHSLKDAKVFLSNESEAVNVDSLCSLLGSGYEDKANKISVEAYYNLCSHLLAQATMGEYPNISCFDRFKSNIKRLLMTRKSIERKSAARNKLLLRLFENEPYRWTIMRALKQIIDEYGA